MNVGGQKNGVAAFIGNGAHATHQIADLGRFVSAPAKTRIVGRTAQPRVVTFFLRLGFKRETGFGTRGWLPLSLLYVGVARLVLLGRLPQSGAT